MSTDTREVRLARRISDLYATDQQFADARPSEAVAHAIEAPELSLPQIVQTVVDGYADRPALGQRAVQFVTDPSTGRTSAERLPRFDTVTYRELSDRVDAVAAALAQSPVRTGDRVGRRQLPGAAYLHLGQHRDAKGCDVPDADGHELMAPVEHGDVGQ